MRHGDETSVVVTSRLGALLGWIRRNSLWPVPLGLSCCGAELRTTLATRSELQQVGVSFANFSPRQSDVLIVAGTITGKMTATIIRMYDQMPGPKYVIAAGACACSGGIFRSYNVVRGLHELVPVDVYVPGCPPTPEALIRGVRELQAVIRHRPTKCGAFAQHTGDA